MSTKSIEPVNAERSFSIEELFFSTTDRRGVITSGNEVFVRVSGYSLEELLGSPHNVIRHSDMPRAVFMLLWDYIESGKPIAAYVKNMAKDGRYYWVTALVMPIENGYLSIRLKPSSALLQEVQAVYADMLSIEKSANPNNPDRRPAMCAAAARLNELLQSRGFADYDAFMHTALVEEMWARDQAMDSARTIMRDGKQPGEGALRQVQENTRRCLSLQKHFQQIFCGLESYMDLHEKLGEKSRTIMRLSHAVGRLSLNATIESARRRDKGACLGVIASWMREGSKEISTAITELDEQVAHVTLGLKKTAFDIAASRLNIEMTTFFLSELLDPVLQGDDASGIVVRKNMAENSISSLVQAFSSCVKGTAAAMDELHRGLSQLDLQLDHLLNLTRILSFAHVVGKVESVRAGDSVVLVGVFDQMFDLITDARRHIEELMKSIASISVLPIRTQEVEDFVSAVSKNVSAQC